MYSKLKQNKIKPFVVHHFHIYMKTNISLRDCALFCQPCFLSSDTASKLFLDRY